MSEIILYSYSIQYKKRQIQIFLDISYREKKREKNRVPWASVDVRLSNRQLCRMYYMTREFF